MKAREDGVVILGDEFQSRVSVRKLVIEAESDGVNPRQMQIGDGGNQTAKILLLKCHVDERTRSELPGNPTEVWQHAIISPRTTVVIVVFPHAINADVKIVDAGCEQPFLV